MVLKRAKKFVPLAIKQRIIRSLGMERQTRPPVGVITDMIEGDKSIIATVSPYTMTGELRVESLLKSVRHVLDAGIPGAFVECGVWKGGSILAMILQLQELGCDDRDIYLYDTFEGMSEPTAVDVSAYNDSALDALADVPKGERLYDHYFNADVFNEDLVKALLFDTGYPKHRLHFVKGKVEDTIPATIPDDIAILRLDTDWYESTRHEMLHLYPRLAKGGILIIDDYGHWEGAKIAVEEYFSQLGEAKPLLHRIDYAGRIAHKLL